MANAIFKRKYFANVLCLVCGLLIIGLFLLAWFLDSEANLQDLLSGVLWGVLICVVSIICLFYNYGAYLLIDNQGNIKGKYHFIGKLHCHLSDVAYAAGRFNTLIIELKSGKTYTIMGIEEPWLLASVIGRHLSFDVTQQPEELIKKQNDLKVARKKAMIYAFVGAALLFAILFVTVLLTGQREMYEFTLMDWIIFALMCVAETATTVAMFYFAIKLGKYNVPIERLQYQIQRRIVETSPVLPGKVIKVFADEKYTGRMTVFGYPNDDSVYYTVQKFAPDHTLAGVYESKVFENIEQLSDAVAPLIDITETVLCG